MAKFVDAKQGERCEVPAARRQAWVVVYQRNGERMPTLREVYWSQEVAEDRAQALAAECHEILVGLMSWAKDPIALAPEKSTENR